MMFFFVVENGSCGPGLQTETLGVGAGAGVGLGRGAHCARTPPPSTHWVPDGQQVFLLGQHVAPGRTQQPSPDVA
jgi:hypothetical protein